MPVSYTHLDVYKRQLQSKIGIDIEILEMCDLKRSFDKVSGEDVVRKRREIENAFVIAGDSAADKRVKKPTEEQLDWSAKVASAQEKMVQEYKLDALSYYYHGSEGTEYQDIQSGFIVGHSLLTANHVPCAGEADIKTCVAMKICDLLSLGGSYCEIVTTDYDLGTIIVGHDGPFHIAIAAEKPVLRGMGVYHGKQGDVYKRQGLMSHWTGTADSPLYKEIIARSCAEEKMCIRDRAYGAMRVKGEDHEG